MFNWKLTVQSICNRIICSTVQTKLISLRRCSLKWFYFIEMAFMWFVFLTAILY